MSILERSKLNCHAKIKFLVKALSHMMSLMFMFIKLKQPKGVNVFVSRSHPEFIKRIMEQEIPEVFDGTVEIMSVSREAGDRTKGCCSQS